MVVSILAELYDPCGFWDPWKLQLKLMSQSLAGIVWDEYIQAEDQGSKLSILRICIPADKDSVFGIRLICLTDAVITAGGAAVYAGRKLKDSTWSCTLVASKSKLKWLAISQLSCSTLLFCTLIS